MRFYLSVALGALCGMVAAVAALGIWQLIDAPTAIQVIVSAALAVAVIVGIIFWRAVDE